MVFRRVTDEGQLFRLAETLKQDFPYSCTMHNNLLFHARRLCSTGTFYVLDDSPDSHVVMWRNNDVASQFTVYCREREVCQLQKALKETPLVDWHGNLHIGRIPHYLLGPIKEVTHHLGLSLDSAQCHTFTYHPHLDTQPLRSPDADSRLSPDPIVIIESLYHPTTASDVLDVQPGSYVRRWHRCSRINVPQGFVGPDPRPAMCLATPSRVGV